MKEFPWLAAGDFFCFLCNFILNQNLLSKKPKFTYLVGSDAKNAFFASKFPKKFVLKRMLKHIEKLGKD